MPVDPRIAALDAPDAAERAFAAAALGIDRRPRRGAAQSLDRLTRLDPDPRVRAAALAARVKRAPAGALRSWQTAATDPDASVRRRACESAPGLRSAACIEALIARLDDEDPLVAEAAAFALGEYAGEARTAVPALSSIGRVHADPLVREAAVAALGAIADPAGLDTILAACTDKPAIRRRAVLALAPFEGPAVDAALEAALADRDWQVRQAAEDLLAE